MAKYGRAPDELLPGMMPIIAAPSEAREKLAKPARAWLTLTNAAVLVASRIGYDASGHPLMVRRRRRRHRSARRAHLHERAYERGAVREHDPARSTTCNCGGARPLGRVRHAQERSPTRLKKRFVAGAADGTMLPLAVFPGAFEDFVDLVVPGAAPRPLPRGIPRHNVARHPFGLPAIAGTAAPRRPVGAV